ncbi:MAG: hypothetical protein KAV45_02595 [Calditrichia bacterium]|nr:hypothetical protein [Calditrichia bacterium]
MYRADTKFFYRNQLSEERIELLKKSMSLFEIPSKGLAFILESDDYSSYINETWRFPAQFIDIEHGGIEEMSPDHILELMESRQYRYLLWISRQICEGDPIKFVWILCHELRHMEQSQITFDLLIINNFLRLAFSFIISEPINFINIIPTELDAQLRAWKSVIQIFNEKVATNFIEDKILSNDKSYEILKKYTADDHFDVLNSILNFLIKYKTDLNRYIAESDEEYIKNYDIDFWCEKIKLLQLNT